MRVDVVSIHILVVFGSVIALVLKEAHGGILSCNKPGYKYCTTITSIGTFYFGPNVVLAKLYSNSLLAVSYNYPFTSKPIFSHYEHSFLIGEGPLFMAAVMISEAEAIGGRVLIEGCETLLE